MINALAIGLAYYVCLLLTTGITGGCLNPAFALIQLPYQIFYINKMESYIHIPLTGIVAQIYAIYIFAPLCGGIMAGLYQKYVNEVFLWRSEKAKTYQVQYE